MEFDVVIVGAGPAGLAAACRLGQLNAEQDLGLSVCLVEKGSEVGAHIVSGAILETTAFDELFPDGQTDNAPLGVRVTQDQVLLLIGANRSIRLPSLLVPAGLRNEGNRVVSLGNLCRWLAERAEGLGVEILAGFPAAEILYDKDGRVCGIVTGDFGRDKNGHEKQEFQAGYELKARWTLFAEGCRGHLGQELIKRFGLDRDTTPQHYGIGIKELWDVPAARHERGKVLHTLGWPLGMGKTTGGGFLYHLDGGQVAVGLITDLNYSNPWLDPYEEFQRYKQHATIARVLAGGTRVAYGARALTKGGLQALPKSVFPGGVLLGDTAGLLNPLKLKGSHTAMKSGMLAAEAVAEAARSGHAAPGLDRYETLLKESWIHAELRYSRNCGPALHKLGTLVGAAYCFLDQSIFRGKLPLTLEDDVPDHATLEPAVSSRKIAYPKPDGVLSFDRLSSVFLSSTNHEEDQPCHLLLTDPDIPINENLPRYAEPARRYCPAAVYEIVEEAGTRHFRINAQNCVHCKTCDIKDPAQNIRWTSPEGGGGPNYTNM